jgi:hypothetical protein
MEENFDIYHVSLVPFYTPPPRMFLKIIAATSFPEWAPTNGPYREV